MAMSNDEYIESMYAKIMPNFYKYMEVLLGIDGFRPVLSEKLNLYFNSGDSIELSRDKFNTIEGINYALHEVINAKVKGQVPSRYLLSSINELLYNNVDYYPNSAVNTDAVSRSDEYLNAFIHPVSLYNIYKNLCSLLKQFMFTKHNYVTLLIFMESVLIHRFDSFCDISGVRVSEIKSMIADARGGNDEFFIRFLISRTFSLKSDSSNLDDDICVGNLITYGVPETYARTLSANILAFKKLGKHASDIFDSVKRMYDSYTFELIIERCRKYVYDVLGCEYSKNSDIIKLLRATSLTEDEAVSMISAIDFAKGTVGLSEAETTIHALLVSDHGDVIGDRIYKTAGHVIHDVLNMMSK